MPDCTVSTADLVERIFVSNNETIWDPSRLSGKCGDVPKSLKLRHLSLFVAGIDVGAATAKAVILNENGICSSAIMPTGFDVVEVSRDVMESAFDRCNSAMKDLALINSTGYAPNAIILQMGPLRSLSAMTKGPISS